MITIIYSLFEKIDGTITQKIGATHGFDTVFSAPLMVSLTR
jgi:hypothetical protein